MKSRYGVTLGVLTASGLLALAGDASAYSTKLHMVTGYHLAKLLRDNTCRVTVGGWNRVFGPAGCAQNATGEGCVDLRATVSGVPDATTRNPSQTIELNAEICRLITSDATRQYFISGTTGPDTFPGAFGNTDPTHALLWNTAWQIPVLWQNAQTDQEKAFVLGWVVHFAGDLNAHGLANLHATGVWMKDTKFETVWKHILTEYYYAQTMVPYPDAVDGVKFDNRLVWPEAFVKKMFFNPNSPIYKHNDYLWLRYVNEDGAIGVVSKVFGAFFRTMFLLWDFHARQQNIWDGRKEFLRQPVFSDDSYIPRHDEPGFRPWLHWAVADQAVVYHQRQGAEVERVIENWYVSTHRAQQATVADERGQFDGTCRYLKEELVPGTLHKRPYPGACSPGARKEARFYESKGPDGILGAYDFLYENMKIYASSLTDFITITEDSFPRLYRIKQAIERFGYVGQLILEALRQFTRLLTLPLRLIGDAIKGLIKDYVKQKIEEYLTDDIQKICNERVPGMCRAIDAQRAAFKVEPGKIDTYLNWPIYRNTITAGALMLKQMESLSRESGTETDSPVFGLPSGDFGCTLPCTRLFQQNPALFMPAAGFYYQNRAVQDAMPDYCMASNNEARRSGFAPNDVFQGKTNNYANSTATGSATFTCVAKVTGHVTRGAGVKSEACGVDNYAADANANIFMGDPESPPGKIKKFFASLYDAISGRWNYASHSRELPRDGAVSVMPTEIDLNGGVTQFVTPAGLATTARTPPAPVCYSALGFNRTQTTAGPRPSPVSENRDAYRRVEQYTLDLGGFLNTIVDVIDWIANALHAIGEFLANTWKDTKCTFSSGERRNYLNRQVPEQGRAAGDEFARQFNARLIGLLDGFRFSFASVGTADRTRILTPILNNVYTLKDQEAQRIENLGAGAARDRCVDVFTAAEWEQAAADRNWRTAFRRGLAAIETKEAVLLRETTTEPIVVADPPALMLGSAIQGAGNRRLGYFRLSNIGPDEVRVRDLSVGQKGHAAFSVALQGGGARPARHPTWGKRGRRGRVPTAGGAGRWRNGRDRGVFG